MTVLVVGALLVLLVAGALLAGATALASDGDRGLDGHFGTALGAPAAIAGGVIVVVVLLAVAGLGTVGSTREPTTRPGDDDEPVALTGSPATFDGRVDIDAAGSSFRPHPVVGDLAEGDVVEVRGEGYLGAVEGAVAQCERIDSPVCRNVLPILTDADGRLRVPYRVEGSASGEVLVVEVDLVRGAARLVFGAVPMAPGLTLSEGDRTAELRGGPPGERIEVRRCGPQAATIASCETLGSRTVGPDGSASITLANRPRAGAVLTAVGDDGFALTEPVRLASPARAPAEVHLASAQLAAGFGLAALLLAIAVTLIRTTDWRVPAEAATPFLDRVPAKS